MEWLNYHHLYYFWTVARLGSVTRASAELRVAQPTVSGQLRALETALGEALFVRARGGLTLTGVGRTAFRYADEIFSLGRELQDSLRGRPSGRTARFVVGLSDALPKLVSYQLLAPAFALPDAPQVVCRQDKPERLLADLAIHALDLVISDAPVGASVSVRAYNHLLGECGVTFVAAPPLAAARRRGFPASLDGAPVLLPTSNAALRRALDAWFDAQRVRPRVVGECDDSALLKVMGRAGLGVVAVPQVAEDEVARQYGLKRVGRTDAVRERFYAVSLERRLKHPAIVAISQAARRQLFGSAERGA